MHFLQLIRHVAHSKGGAIMDNTPIVKGGCGHTADELTFNAYVCAGSFILISIIVPGVMLLT